MIGLDDFLFQLLLLVDSARLGVLADLGRAPLELLLLLHSLARFRLHEALASLNRSSSPLLGWQH